MTGTETRAMVGSKMCGMLDVLLFCGYVPDHFKPRALELIGEFEATFLSRKPARQDNEIVPPLTEEQAIAIEAELHTILSVPA